MKITKAQVNILKQKVDKIKPDFDRSDVTEKERAAHLRMPLAQYRKAIKEWRKLQSDWNSFVDGKSKFKNLYDVKYSDDHDNFFYRFSPDDGWSWSKDKKNNKDIEGAINEAVLVAREQDAWASFNVWREQMHGEIDQAYEDSVLSGNADIDELIARIEAGPEV